VAVRIGFLLAIFIIVPLTAPYLVDKISDVHVQDILRAVPALFDWRYFVVLAILLLALFTPLKDKLG
jgi:hypothetical protein